MSAAEFGRRSDDYIREGRQDTSEESMGVGLRLVRAANTFVQASEREVHRPLGLRWTGFSVLFVLSMFQTLEARALARFLGVTRQATSLVLATLDRDGHVERRARSSGDRRLVPIHLSPQGETVARDSLLGQLNLSDDWFACLDSQEQTELNRILDKLLTHNSTRTRPARRAANRTNAPSGTTHEQAGD